MSGWDLCVAVCWGIARLALTALAWCGLLCSGGNAADEVMEASAGRKGEPQTCTRQTLDDQLIFPTSAITTTRATARHVALTSSRAQTTCSAVRKTTNWYGRCRPALNRLSCAPSSAIMPSGLDRSLSALSSCSSSSGSTRSAAFAGCHAPNTTRHAESSRSPGIAGPFDGRTGLTAVVLSFGRSLQPESSMTMLR
jgi:hypothetical protein